MHTVRNRLASRPPAAVPFAAGGKGPNPPTIRHGPVCIGRGSLAVSMVIPDENGLIEERPHKRRNPKGKKARKAAARMAAQCEAEVLLAASTKAAAPVSSERRSAKAKGRARSKPKSSMAAKARSEALDPAFESQPIRSIQPEQLPAISASWPPLGSYKPHVPAVSARPTNALTVPARPSPSIMPQAEPEVRALLLPARPEPLVGTPVLPDDADTVPRPKPEPAVALAALPDEPLPRSRALVPARRQGVIDMIAFLLRDSGRRLARWSAQRRKTQAEREALRRAEARQLNLQRELEALDALLRHKG